MFVFFAADSPTLTWPYGHGYVGWMKSIAAGQFKDRCLQILDDVARSKTSIVVTKRGRPVARIVPFVDAKQGSLTGSVLKEAGDPFGTGGTWDAARS